MGLEVGLKGKWAITVTEEMTAKHIESGMSDVFATPMMVVLFEKTAMTSVHPLLEEGQSTVGTALNITHDAATPVGMKVRCESELIEIDGRRLVFKVEAFDEKGHIGGGTHERFIINSEKFQQKADAKKIEA